MLFLPNAEFYITNVCNFTCQNCNRFNHMGFKGSYKWHKGHYEKWAEKVHINEIWVLGGEPTLCPDLPNFILGISKLWPRSRKIIVTNGSNLKSDLVHKLMARYSWDVELDLHSKPGSKINKYIISNLIKNYGPFKKIRRFKKRLGVPTSANHSFATVTHLTTKYNVRVEIHEQPEFYNNAFKDEKNLILHDGSDPVEAHENCQMKTCHHFKDGKLYKCGVVCLVPDFMKQKGKSYPKIYDQYAPLDADNITQKALDVLDNDPIPQCKHCPASQEDWTLKPMQSGMLGNKLKNI